ncbi:secreted RxLR effector protein 161-like [Nicotiana sylvestris]|uniref:Uncharacterized mitochondrial protein AtMg00810-like n=1 Tax=Nicotiana tabacum TaxID=4097 RepID=A0A1S3YTE1_TOBAC|nr:PREDICTED: uncharacterized mitochondrial protein AtMg00810-like [Nicotiana tabacum]
MKDVGELKFFLGIGFFKSSKGIHMCQRKYSLELISELVLGGAKTARTPLECNQKLTSIEFDRAFHKDAAHEDPILEDAREYQRLVGRLLYLTMIRPDISFGVHVLSQYMHAPKQSHMEAALRIVRYLEASPGLELLMPSTETRQLQAFCNSDWGSCLQTRRSVTGCLVKFGEALVSWKFKKQETVARSSAEAEFRSMVSCVAEVTWLTGLFKELGI